ncbi:hypothetical protein MPSEU_000520300 [Mayamaea pseudoterrestris]|nr:hypothetical protein MPSEU_000520300 [Mayamaea pseudoterrestris]
MSFQGLFESVKKRRKEKTQQPPAKGHQHRQIDSELEKNLQGVRQPLYAQSSTVKHLTEDKKDNAGLKHNGKILSSNKRKRQPVSQEARALSAQLKDLSRHKRLDQVLQLYWNAEDRDAHHACMVIDCCARCGDVSEAERVFDEAMLRRDTSFSNIEMHTALLKAYAHSGLMVKADALFARMCERQSRIFPNVRTLNTLLRGCLWTAACLHENVVIGGVVTSEMAWKSYVSKSGQVTLDCSSYEYSISLLCQALRVQDAMDRIEMFMKRYEISFKGKAGFRGGDHTSLETLAVVYLSLAKAFGLLGRWNDTWTACQRVLSATDGSRARLVVASTSNVAVSEARLKQTTGGKRSWNSASDGSSQRTASNSSFRAHRLSELEWEARTILKLRTDGVINRISHESLASCLLTRLLYFSGGGTTDLNSTATKLDAVNDRTTQQRSLLAPAWYSFGLCTLVDMHSRGFTQTGMTPDPQEIYKLFRLDEDMKRIIRDDGRVDFNNLFSDGSQPIDLELGSGFGEWIAKQAQTNPLRNYIAVELRADRVSHILCKLSLLLGLRNVCVVGSDCAKFFRMHMPPARISNVYVNHPEPPTQTLGDNANDLNAIMNGGSEPAHMLCSSTLIAVAVALKPGGKIVIISDNRWYSRLLCATMVKVNRRNKCRLMACSLPEAKDIGLQFVEHFNDGATLYQTVTTSNAKDGRMGETWFDRLWQTGAGRHAERLTRFVVIVTKI